MPHFEVIISFLINKEGKMKNYLLLGLTIITGCNDPAINLHNLTESEFKEELTRIGTCVKLSDSAGYSVDKDRFNFMFNSLNFLRHCPNADAKAIELSKCIYRFSRSYKQPEQDDSSLNDVLAKNCLGGKDNTFAERHKECISELSNSTIAALAIVDEEIRRTGGIDTKRAAQEKFATTCFDVFEL